MSKKQKIRCLFGYHKYTIEGKSVMPSTLLICEYCRKAGICVCSVCNAWVKRDGKAERYKVTYDENGEVITGRWNIK